MHIIFKINMLLQKRCLHERERKERERERESRGGVGWKHRIFVVKSRFYFLNNFKYFGRGLPDDATCLKQKAIALTVWDKKFF